MCVYMYVTVWFVCVYLFMHVSKYVCVYLCVCFIPNIFNVLPIIKKTHCMLIILLMHMFFYFNKGCSLNSSDFKETYEMDLKQLQSVNN